MSKFNIGDSVKVVANGLAFSPDSPNTQERGKVGSIHSVEAGLRCPHCDGIVDAQQVSYAVEFLTPEPIILCGYSENELESA